MRKAGTRRSTCEHSGPRWSTRWSNATTRAIRAFKDDVLAHLGKPADRCALARGVLRASHHMPAYPEEGALARRPHPDGEIGSVGEGRPRERRLPQARRTRGVVRIPKRQTTSRHRLLPDRRAVEPHVVRPDPPSRQGRRAQLRRSWTEWGNAVRVPVVVGTEPGAVPGSS